LPINFANIKGVLFDMDGVIYRNSLALPGAADTLAWLAARGIPYACITNNASQLPSQYAARLRAMGMLVSPEHILTSALVTNLYLRGIAPQGTTVYAIGMDGLQQLLFGDGYFVRQEQNPQYVVVGADFEVTYAKLRTACFAIRAGATFIGTNPDVTFPTEQGLAPGVGALIIALEACTGVKPFIIGKPEPAIFQAGIALLGSEPATTLMIGDSLRTDVAGAVPLGLPTAFVLSGVSDEAELAASPVQPDAVFVDLADLLATWRATVD
jgi:4-nitrophenyl phosphatase